MREAGRGEDEREGLPDHREGDLSEAERGEGRRGQAPLRVVDRDRRRGPVRRRVVVDVGIDVMVHVVRGLAAAGDEPEHARHLEEREHPNGAQRDREWREFAQLVKRHARHAHSFAGSSSASR